MTPRGHGLRRELLTRRGLLTRRIAGQADPDGSLDDRCRGRIIESALLLTLIRRIGSHPQTQHRLMRYLRQSRPGHPFEHLVQHAVLHGPAGLREAAGFMAGFRHPTGERKRVLLDAVLALVSDTPPAATVEPTRNGNAVWTDVTLRSIKVIKAGRGQIDPADHAFVTAHLRTAPAGTVWQGNLLAHLLALHALAASGQRPPLLQDGINTLIGHLNPDGGLPFISGQDIWISALAGSALAEAGDSSQTAQRLADFVASRQLPDGGWGYDRGTTQSDVDDTSRCMVFLRSISPARYHQQLTAGRAYLSAIVSPDGGFPTYVLGAPSEADLTAGALIALSSPHSASQLTDRALRYLIASQDGHGAFEPSWTRSWTSVTAHAVNALALARGPTTTPARKATAAAVDAVITTQNSDGGWGNSVGAESDLISTAHAVIALASAPLSTQLTSAIAYLLDHHDADGPSACPPDQVGPRPIPYDFPLLADIHVLTALNHTVNSRLEEGRLRVVRSDAVL